MIIRFLERSTKEDCVIEEGHSIAHRKKNPKNTSGTNSLKTFTKKGCKSNQK